MLASRQEGEIPLSRGQRIDLVCLMDKAKMEKARVSDEWLLGATVGGYLILTFVLHFWGSAFVHYWCGNSPYPLSTRDGRFPVYLVFLVPAVIVGVIDWAQAKFAQTCTASRRFVRAALWMNLIGILGFLAAVASNYGPDGNNGFFAIVILLGMACWPMGLVVSLGNLVRACIRRLSAPLSERPSS
jgi:hypothetical protein